MALAHEIAVDKDFTLQKIQPANAVEKKARHGSNQSPSSFHLNTIVILQVKEIMQKAFWDLLEQQLEADPPQYTQVVTDFFLWSQGLVPFSLVRLSLSSQRSRQCSIASFSHR